MPILDQDIQILKAQVQDDVPEGGGAATGATLSDGVSNNLFPDVSEMDRAVGRVNLRKVFPAVRTPNTDRYGGARVFISDAPDDPNTSAVLFSTGDHFDTRVSAQSRIESYLTQGAAHAGLLFGPHITGMRTITLLQRDTIAAPSIGATLVLRKNQGLSSEAEQYVRVSEVTSRTREFQVPSGSANQTFKRLEVTLSLSDPLRDDHVGFEAADSYNDASISFAGRSRVYSTIVADAARYYGITPLLNSASLGDFSVIAKGIFASIVPSAQVETPVADSRMNSQAGALVAEGDIFSQTLTSVFTTANRLFVGGGILPGTLSVVRSSVMLTDRGGKLLQGTTEVGAVDYASGILSLSTNIFGTGGGTHTVSYRPAVTPRTVTRSIGIPVTQAGQRLSYTLTLDPLPAAASLQVEYLSGGRWYVMGDDGSGALRGADSAIGAGMLNMSSGTVTITLGAMPDVGSQIILSWAPHSAAATLPVAALDFAGRAYAEFELGTAVKAGTLVLTWNDGSIRTATDNGVGGFTGDATGMIWYGSGKIRIAPNTLPGKGTIFTADLTRCTPRTMSQAQFVDGGASWTASTGITPIKPGSVEMAVGVSRADRVHPGIDQAVSELWRITDNGAGSLLLMGPHNTQVCGTINYGSGAISLTKVINGLQVDATVFQGTTPFGGTAADPKYVFNVGTELRTQSVTITNGWPSSVTIPSWVWWSGGAASSALNARFATVDAGVGAIPLTLNELNISLPIDYASVGIGGAGLTYAVAIS